MAPSDRDLAQQAIADMLAKAADRDRNPYWTAEPCLEGHYPCKDAPVPQVIGSPAGLAAAILDTPGVEVVPIYHPLDNAYRMVIRLPVGVIPHAGVAAQHQDRTEGEKP